MAEELFATSSRCKANYKSGCRPVSTGLASYCSVKFTLLRRAFNFALYCITFFPCSCLTVSMCSPRTLTASRACSVQSRNTFMH